MKDKLRTLLSDADSLIIVPPFAGLDRPSLGAHILQSCASGAGHSVKILYANILLAQKIGEINYEAICFAPSSELIGEKFFAGAAYGGKNVCTIETVRKSFENDFRSSDTLVPRDIDKIHDFSLQIEEWIEEVTEVVCSFNFMVVGCTTTFEQTSASIALLKSIKNRKPEQITILGGANCEGEMADGIHSLNGGVDYIFSGECENVFPDFLRDLKNGILPQKSTVSGTPCHTLDAIPTPDFSEYYLQLSTFLESGEIVKSEGIWLPYESSRGCWWGQKFHCTFCGINGEGMPFREKAPERVVEELDLLIAKHPTNNICMVDNIMPHHYFRSLLPAMADKFSGLNIFYEQKANLSLQKVQLLKKAGVTIIQPGIEALSTPLLKLMKKGVKSTQNLALLRYARAVDMAVNWNLLYSFPGDRIEWYEETLAMLPFIVHLNPPSGVCHLSIDRFSPYFDRPEDYGLTNIKPIPAYFATFPPNSKHRQIAYHFEADYESDSRRSRDVISELIAEVNKWRGRWENEDEAVPTLYIAPMSENDCIMMDSRSGSGEVEIQFINKDQARAALTGQIANANVEKWALDSKVCFRIDNEIAPLAVADPEFFEENESGYKLNRVSFDSLRSSLVAA